MSLLVLRNFDRAQAVLRYSTNLGVQAVSPRKADDGLDRGFFTEHNGRYYGVFASVSGAVAFIDNLKWLLTKSGASSKSIRLPDGKIQFVLSIDGAPVYEVIYQSSNAFVDN